MDIFVSNLFVADGLGSSREDLLHEFTDKDLIARHLLFWPGHGKRLESRLGPEERGGLMHGLTF